MRHLLAAALACLAIGCCPRLPLTTSTTVTVRDTTVTIPAVTSADTLCHEEAASLAAAILSGDSLCASESVTLVDTSTGVVVTLSVTPSGGLAVRTVTPKRAVTIRGAIRDSTVVVTVPAKGKPPNARAGWIGFAIGLAVGAVLSLAGIILFRRLTS
jgi:hypothetical protein